MDFVRTCLLMEPNKDPIENDPQQPKTEPAPDIDENKRAKELEETPEMAPDETEEVVGPQPGAGEESGHS